VTAVGIALLLVGRATRKDALLATALVLGVAGAWCFLLTYAGQFVLAEQRPIDGGQMRWFALDGHGVSGHAAATALLALPVRHVLLRRFRPLVRNLVAAALLVWAGVVAWSRVWMGMHHAWNVIAGLALGLWTGSGAVDAWREEVPNVRPEPKWRFLGG
jgi:membrane-associated phospholipid phosphatase